MTVGATPRPHYPVERAPGTPYIGHWVGPLAGLEGCADEKISFPTVDVTQMRRAFGDVLHCLRWTLWCRDVLSSDITRDCRLGLLRLDACFCEDYCCHLVL